VTGAGGFIGSHLVTYLKNEGCWVRGVDLKWPEFSLSTADAYLLADLRHPEAALAACADVDEVYALAADMGGMGYLSTHHAGVLHDNALVNLHTIEAARTQGVGRLFFASSACIYPRYRQAAPDVPPLREEDAYPADCEDGYGWEKLVTERLCGYYRTEYGLETRVARFHAIYGPQGTWRGGREKAPAALCRKVALAPEGGEVEVWGDGRQTRSFCYITDLVEGVVRLMRSGHAEPLNIGRDDMVTVDDLASLVIEISGKDLTIRHVDGPQGVRGRNSDNTRLRQVLGWEPQVGLRAGLEATYRWVESQVRSLATVP
jgi:GDP-D-mannose 3', 5'-epimerase